MIENFMALREFLSSRQFPECSIKSDIEQRSWKQSSSSKIVKFHISFSFLFTRRTCERRQRIEKVITRLYFSHYYWESNGKSNKELSVAVKTKKRKNRKGKRDLSGKNEIYRLFPSNSFPFRLFSFFSSSILIIWEKFLHSISRVLCVICSCVHAVKISGEIKFIFLIFLAFFPFWLSLLCARRYFTVLYIVLLAFCRPSNWIVFQ